MGCANSAPRARAISREEHKAKTLDVLSACSSVIVDLPRQVLPPPWFYHTKNPLTGTTNEEKLESLKELRKPNITALNAFFKSIDRAAFRGAALSRATSMEEVGAGRIFLKQNNKSDES